MDGSLVGYMDGVWTIVYSGDWCLGVMDSRATMDGSMAEDQDNGQ